MEKAKELKPVASNLVYDLIRDKAQVALERYREENNLDSRYTNNAAPNEVADLLKAPATDEFFEMYPDTSEDSLQDDIKTYISENYDADYMLDKVDRRENTDEIKNEMTDDLLMFLNNMPDYCDVDDSYWIKGARRVPFTEFNNYLSEDGAALFAEKYEPDWRETLAE